MWRSIFLALGIMGIILGVECMVIDSANLYAADETQASTFINPRMTPSPSASLWQPKERTPWLFLAGGTLTILYAFSLPKRFERFANGQG